MRLELKVMNTTPRMNVYSFDGPTPGRLKHFLSIPLFFNCLKKNTFMSNPVADLRIKHNANSIDCA